MRTSHVDLPGNNRPLKQGARRLGPADLSQLVTVTVIVRGKHQLPEPDPTAAPMSLAEVEQKYGADPKDIERVKSVLSSAPYGLKVIGSSPASSAD
jgi:hypothetical protein